ncbi:MAG: hypothetical protein CML04_09610 [Pseudozobellia sp.]|nr:hypothetical protein [Pseudozobellia sp.]MBG50766.1 hypothetical protein [Pseudozobellia sp.]|tara:strand:- start:25326 stop:26183 length:858 start_codon:yes stop_codon:yes gene_type:complete
MIVNRIIVLLGFVGILCSCNNDDDNTQSVEPPRPLSEVLAEDEAEIQEYLKTHYYNYEDFESPSEDFDYKIVLKEIPEDDTTNIRPLSEFIETLEVKVPSSFFLIEGEEETVVHNLYYVIARQGIGDALTVADSAYVSYQGQLLSGDIFDNSRVNSPLWFDLANLQVPSSSILTGTAARGFGEAASLLKGGGEPILNEDGTYSVDNYGVGFFIFPSGLGYYNIARSVIPSYSPMIFTMDMIAVKETDHDGDGTPSMDEDSNGDGYLYNDDTDGDGLPDYLDADTN